MASKTLTKADAVEALLAETCPGCARRYADAGSMRGRTRIVNHRTGIVWCQLCFEQSLWWVSSDASDGRLNGQRLLGDCYAEGRWEAEWDGEWEAI
jgi:TPR repeat protein